MKQDDSQFDTQYHDIVSFINERIGEKNKKSDKEYYCMFFGEIFLAIDNNHGQIEKIEFLLRVVCIILENNCFGQGMNHFPYIAFTDCLHPYLNFNTIPQKCVFSFHIYVLRAFRLLIPLFFSKILEKPVCLAFALGILRKFSNDKNTEKFVFLLEDSVSFLEKCITFAIDEKKDICGKFGFDWLPTISIVSFLNLQNSFFSLPNNMILCICGFFLKCPQVFNHQELFYQISAIRICLNLLTSDTLNDPNYIFFRKEVPYSNRYYSQELIKSLVESKVLLFVDYLLDMKPTKYVLQLLTLVDCIIPHSYIVSLNSNLYDEEEYRVSYLLFINKFSKPVTNEQKKQINHIIKRLDTFKYEFLKSNNYQ